MSRDLDLDFLEKRIVRGPLDRALDLPPLEVEKVEITPDADGDDYKTARVNTHRIMGTLETSLNELAAIARNSQHPRAYEVVNQIGKTLIDAQKDLLELKRRDQVIHGEVPAEVPSEINHHQHNNLIITSPDLLDQMQAFQKQLKLKALEVIPEKTNGQV